MDNLLRPIELMNIDAVNRRFKNAQQIGNLTAIYNDKFYFKRIGTSVLINKVEFLNFIKHIEKF